ncbi:hypothetical protein P3S68_033023 [Capsicum galapagoense]
MATAQLKIIELDEGWEIMQKGITKMKKILEGQQHSFSSEDSIMLYTTVYNMCSQKPPNDYAQQLYDKYKEVFEEYINSTVLPALREKHDELMLMEFVKRWANHKLMVRWLSRFFRYLDRYFISRRSLPTLNEVGLTCFRDLVYKELNSKARDAVIVLIDQEREGEQIDRALLKNVLDIFVEIGMGEMGYYENDFEDAMLKDTAAYYSRKASSWSVEDSCPDYMLKAEECLKKEKDRASHYLCVSSETKLLEKVQNELLVVYTNQLLEKEHSGCRALLTDDKLEDLSRVFRLSYITPNGLEPVSNMFKQHVIAEGVDLVQEAEDATNSSVLVQQADDTTNSPVLVQQAEDTTNSPVLVQQAEDTTNSKILLPKIVKGAKLADEKEVERIPAFAEPPTKLSYPSVDEELVGFDDHAKNIFVKLTSRRKDLDVISIVGMAGIGKTALARKVYSDVSIIDHFEVRAWCSVGQIYSVRKLFLEILRQIRGDRYLNVDDPASMLRWNLLGKRYLIVLDDICESESWDVLTRCFLSVERRSRIMVTTRNAELAQYMTQHSDPYFLPFIRYEESWELLEKKVFQGESCPLELRSVGTLVAKKCKGLPYLIIMIAGILSRKKRDASTWLEVAYDIGSHTLEEGSMKMIQSSYDLLPDYLKPCLLYMGLFSKDYEIRVSDLLKWWIAEEFVPNIGTLELEETSMSCLSDLVSRNMVVVSKTRVNGEMKCCIILDQVREFCLTKIKEEKFMQHVGKRLCMYIHDGMTSDFKERESFGISQASLEFIAHPKFSISDNKNLFPLLNNLRLIRVLHLLDFYLDDSWAAAFQLLTHLRYLAIFVKVFHIKWVSHLVHLQTLGVRSSYIMVSPAIWKLEKLRHVDINEFPIRWEDGERVKFKESTDIVLHNLKTLGTCSMSLADMTPKFWNKFPNLEQLRLHIDEFGDVPYYSGSRLMTLDMFPTRLRKLSLSETFLTDEIVSSIAKLQHLETLKLSEIYFTGEKHWDLGDNTFKVLRVLKLHRVFMTQWYCSDAYESFPSLEYLVIKSCSKLEEIPLSFADVPTLRLIKVTDCSKSVGDSALKIEKEMEEYGCELQVHILKND